MLTDSIMDHTYPDEQSGYSRQDREDEDQGDDLGRALGVVAERVVGLGLLAVPQRRLVGAERCVLVERYVQVKCGHEESLGRAEGADDDGRLEGVLGSQKLDGEIFVRLYDEES